MMPEEWPIAATAADGNMHARVQGRGRLATVRTDFFLNPAQRLTEQERALMTAMLHCLVSDVASALRAALPSARLAVNDERDVALVSQLTSSGLLDEPDLMALLLRTADEERIATAARARGGRREARVLQGLVSSEHGAVAAAAMALILGRGRRRDRFGQCLLSFDDLSSSAADALVNGIAAAMRSELAASYGVERADLQLTQASQAVLAQRNGERAIDVLISVLVQLIEQSGGVTDELVLAAANEGEIGFVAEVLARRAAIATPVALDELLSGNPRDVMALLRLGQASHELAAGLLAAIGDLLGFEDSGAAIGLFEAMSDAEVQGARAWLRSSPSYRAALELLGQGRG